MKMENLGGLGSIRSQFIATNNNIIKKTIPTKEDFIEAIVVESSFYKNLKHKNISSIVAMRIEDESFELEMKKGKPLVDMILNEEKFNKKKIIEEIISAVTYLHHNGITHGDIKEENIIIIDNSVKLIDFGTASLKDTNICLSTHRNSKSHFLSKRNDVYQVGLVILNIFFNGFFIIQEIEEIEEDEEDVQYKNEDLEFYADKLEEPYKRMVKRMISDDEDVKFSHFFKGLKPKIMFKCMNPELFSKDISSLGKKYGFSDITICHATNIQNETKAKSSICLYIAALFQERYNASLFDFTEIFDVVKNSKKILELTLNFNLIFV